METAHFLTWLIVFAFLSGIGLGVMIWAYVGSGSTSVLFRDPVMLPPVDGTPVETEAIALLQQGVVAFQAGKYRQSVDHFTQAIQLDPTLATAHHNLGLALANLKQDREAVSQWIRASELYAQQDQGEAIALVKQHLEFLKTRKL